MYCLAHTTSQNKIYLAAVLRSKENGLLFDHVMWLPMDKERFMGKCRYISLDLPLWTTPYMVFTTKVSARLVRKKIQTLVHDVDVINIIECTKKDF